MDDNQLIHYISGGRQWRALFCLPLWFNKCPRFRSFTYRHRNKIRRKLRGAESEDVLFDVRAELHFAYLMLLDEHFEVEYEKYGTGENRSPDFTVVFQCEIAFNAEVKRIREAEMTTRFEKLLAKIDGEVRKVVSSLEFGIEPGVMGITRGLLDRLESSKSDVADFIKAMIGREEGNLLNDKQYDYAIAGFEHELILYLVKPGWKEAPGPTSHDGIMPVLYTRKEYRKFGDTICEKVRQLVPGMINVLVVFCSSFTHDEEDLLRAITSINQMLGQGGDAFFIRKGFKGKQDFLNHTRWLSGILFRDSFVPIGEHRERNILWQNGQADLQIPHAIAEYLRIMDDQQTGVSPRAADS